jgi:hypothetical protein
VNDFIYYLYDHRGNTRITYSATKNGSTMTIHPESAFDYEPYGVVLRQYTTGTERSRRHCHALASAPLSQRVEVFA